MLARPAGSIDIAKYVISQKRQLKAPEIIFPGMHVKSFSFLAQLKTPRREVGRIMDTMFHKQDRYLNRHRDSFPSPATQIIVAQELRVKVLSPRL